MVYRGGTIPGLVRACASAWTNLIAKVAGNYQTALAASAEIRRSSRGVANVTRDEAIRSS